MYVWDGTNPNSNGTNNLIFGGSNSSILKVTRTGGGPFDLLSVDMSISQNDSNTTETIYVNGSPIYLRQGMRTYTLNLMGVTEVDFTAIVPFSGTTPYWLMDNVTYNPTPVASGQSTISLSPGWNLISIPVQPADASIASVLSGISGSYSVLWGYPDQAWKVYDPNDSAGSTLSTMEPGKGYWIKMTSAKTLSVSGPTPSASLPLLSGWNLVGYNGPSADAAFALSSLSSLQLAWGYPAGSWQFYAPQNAQNTLTRLRRGAGYWVRASQEDTWTLPVKVHADWTWVSGSNTAAQAGVYGTKGTAASGNVPGARWRAVSWTDTQGNLWLFGGVGYDSIGTPDELNDLWKFDGAKWTWVSGSNMAAQAGVYGTKGTAASGNVPGARNSAVTWTDAQGSLWLFGGQVFDSGYLGQRNDLWKFDGAKWTWVSGSNADNQAGVYGTKGTAASGNVPGARMNAVSWTDAQGNFWLFGGNGLDSAGTPGNLNDLWKFDGAKWTWVSGSNTVSQAGVYGTKGTADLANIPGAREGAVSWTDAQGNFWLFGGEGLDSASASSELNDLWKFDGASWTWVSGSNTVSQAGVYGTQGTSAPGNVPGARYQAVSWTDPQGNFWLFGGNGLADAWGDLNDLWRY